MRLLTIALLLNLSPCLFMDVNAAEDNTVLSADNTRQNSRKFYGGPTAQNQSNKGSSIRSSARLRRAIMAEKGLSVNAQNIKIINRHGLTTLRGPVDNTHEKEIIDSLAHQYCSNYQDELQVIK